MLPLHDENPRRGTPWVTYALLLANVLVFAHQITLPASLVETHLTRWGVVPCELLGALRHLGAPGSLPEVATLLTSMFLHGGWLHIGGNMLFLYIFGDNIEDELGPGRYLTFYVGCGVLASLAQVAAGPASTVPTVGASGAVSGVLGAYMVLHPTARIVTLLFLGFFITRARIPAFLFLGLWFGLQAVQGLAALSTHQAAAGGGVAWFAHLGGFAAGVLVALGVRSARHHRAPRWGRGGRSGR
ncbi:MAG: rhomboid family intramembrane serine protease [Candidatus Sericytochromatia bacterium]|nr:rhomboid family intramembrane serine protease [Candidatus Sericytochromatia bacterium]